MGAYSIWQFSMEFLNFVWFLSTGFPCNRVLSRQLLSLPDGDLIVVFWIVWSVVGKHMSENRIWALFFLHHKEKKFVVEVHSCESEIAWCSVSFLWMYHIILFGCAFLYVPAFSLMFFLIMFLFYLIFPTLNLNSFWF